MSTRDAETDDLEALTADAQAVARIEAVPAVLRLVCQTTGMGFAAVARVTEQSWLACVVLDEIGLGLPAGARLDAASTFCREVPADGSPIGIESVSADPARQSHPAVRAFGIESWVSAPILRSDGTRFGSLCAVDRRPAPSLSRSETLATLAAFARLIAMQLDSDTRRARAEADLVVERAAADLREHFVAVLGHDLRNPVQAVAAMGKVLTRRADAEPKAAQLGERLKTVSRRMSALIDDVLDFTRTRLGSGLGTRMRLQADLASDLREVVEETRLGSPGRAIREAIDISVPVVCDRGRLQQLLSNLLGNAVSHGDAERPISVQAHIVFGNLEIVVSNFGTPIPAGMQEQIFEPYWRPPESAPGGGLGLGLYISRQIAVAHGGTIRAASSVDQGTRFVVVLPVSGPPNG